MHTMTCSHHSTPFLNDFKLYPSSFHHPKTQRYTHFHLSPNEHILISYFSQLGFFFFIHSALLFFFSPLFSCFFFLKGILFINTRALFFRSLVAFFPFLTLLVHFFSLSLTFPIPRSKELKFTNPTTILDANLNEVLMLAKDENNSLSLLILSKFCT